MQVHRLRRRLPRGVLLRGRSDALYPSIFHEDNLPEQWQSYLELNATKAESGECEVITEKKEPLADQ